MSDEIEQAAHAMQDVWDEWCIDTGDHPEWIRREGNLIFADFLSVAAEPMIVAALAAVPVPARQPSTPSRGDVLMVLTVYDDHIAPENRGPWRDRLMGWAHENDEHEAMLKLGYTGVYGFYTCDKCGHWQEIDTRPKVERGLEGEGGGVVE